VLSTERLYQTARDSHQQQSGEVVLFVDGCRVRVPFEQIVESIERAHLASYRPSEGARVACRDAQSPSDVPPATSKDMN
jgi:hypothetical protein